MPPNYQNGKIYAIRAPNTDDIYIGSTTIPLSVRIAQHHHALKRYNNNKGDYYTSYKLLELDGHYIELIEEFACDNKEQLNRREGEIIRTTPNCINRVVAGRTRKEYRENNKDKIKEYYDVHNRIYLEANKDKINENRRKKYETNRDEIQLRRQGLRIIKKILGLL